jgi:hypothetical protein
MAAVRGVFPQATMVENRVDVYPIQVIIRAEIKGQTMTVFQCPQQDLFRKYAARRTKAIQDITDALQDLKEDFDLE